MAIVVNENSYLTIADADTYVAANYVSTDTKYTTWDALSDANKEIYLKRATKKLDRQLIRGAKAVDTQTLQFPRALKLCGRRYEQAVYGVDVNGDRDWYVESAVQQNVIDAQVEESLSLVTQGATANKRAELQAQGVKSFSLGNLSEDYGNASTTQNKTQLLSVEAKELMRFYSIGGVAIC